MRTLIALLFGLLGTVATVNAKDQGGIMSFGKQTICLGRFLVDVPKDAYPVGRDYHYINSFTITKATRAQMQEAISAREKQIGAPDSDEYIHKKITGAKAGSVILARREKDYDAWGRQLGFDLEGFYWMSGYQYLLKSKASYNKLDAALSDMLGVIALASPLRPDEIPNSSGFCVDSSFFPGEPAELHHEKAFVHLRFKNTPDVMVTIDIEMNGEKLDDGLLARVDRKPIPDAYKELARKIKTLRRGQHPVGNVVAEELFETYPTDGTYSTHSFTWEASGKRRDIYAPSIVVNLETGETLDSEKRRPSLTDKQAIELFDSIVNSIRLRPTGGTGAVDKPTPPPRPQAKAPLGTRLPSGSTCSQTGEWVCEQQDAMGGTRRVFAEGEPLPEVLLPVRLNAWQKLLGKPDKRPAATVWTLASLPENRS